MTTATMMTKESVLLFDSNHKSRPPTKSKEDNHSNGWRNTKNACARRNDRASVATLMPNRTPRLAAGTLAITTSPSAPSNTNEMERATIPLSRTRIVTVMILMLAPASIALLIPGSAAKLPTQARILTVLQRNGWMTVKRIVLSRNGKMSFKRIPNQCDKKFSNID